MITAGSSFLEPVDRWVGSLGYRALEDLFGITGSDCERGGASEPPKSHRRTRAPLWQQTCRVTAVTHEGLAADAGIFGDRITRRAPVMYQRGKDHFIVGIVSSLSPAGIMATRIGDQVASNIRGWIIETATPTPTSSRRNEPADLRNWRDPQVGWGLVLAERKDSAADPASNDDIPEPLRELLKVRGTASVFSLRPGLNRPFHFSSQLFPPTRPVHTRIPSGGSAPARCPTTSSSTAVPRSCPGSCNTS